MEGACTKLINNSQEGLWIQDPVLDKERNLLASISGEKFEKIENACKDFVQSGEIDYDPYQVEDFIEEHEDGEIVKCERQYDKATDYHTSKSLCEKAGNYIQNREPDVETSCETFVNGQIVTSLETDPEQLSEKRAECIPGHMDEAIKSVKNEHPDAETFHKDGQFCIVKERKITRPRKVYREKYVERMKDRGYDFKN